MATTKLDISIDPELESKYVNLVEVSSTGTEVFLNFIFLKPSTGGVRKGEVVHSVIMTPQSIKGLTSNLIDWVCKYQHAHGAIQIGHEKDTMEQVIEKHFGVRQTQDKEKRTEE